jgi:hypothetical protein
MPTLTWQHTELGRRTACGSYHVVRKSFECVRLLDADWNEVAVCPTVEAAQRLAEQLATAKAKKSEPADKAE